ncbi:ATP-binding protein [Mucilaginibacter sp. HC2]|uniref:helicase HerA domain-containing protein n=1 Tax=Mucilaginibacter inviolabilis TaxID=2714892 RepID=UPI00140D7953|nr:DUF87 domain-containing protein [Mucilaginibacter inviolabilis]NHA07376.1 ATP-binding protein [Mucilaginibacter inviolabilis]
MKLIFERVYQGTTEDPVLLLKDYLLPGVRLEFGKSSGGWFWHIHLPHIQRAMLPSAVNVLIQIPVNTSQAAALPSDKLWTLINRPFKRGPNPFNRTITQLIDIPLESLFSTIRGDFWVGAEVLPDTDGFLPGLKDSSHCVRIITGSQLAADRLSRWFDAEPVTYEHGRRGEARIYVGFSELHFLFRVPVFIDAVLPHLQEVPQDIIRYIQEDSDRLCRGLLIAGLSGSGKTTTACKILSGLLQQNKLASLLVTDVKGEYQAFAKVYGLTYFDMGRDLNCLKQLGVNPFIPLDELRLSNHIDLLSILLSIGASGGSGVLLPAFMKLLLEGYYYELLWQPLVKDGLPPDIFEQRLSLLNMTGSELRKRLGGTFSILNQAHYKLFNYWKMNASTVMKRMFQQGGQSNGRAEIMDVISSRLALLETSVISYMCFENGRSFDHLKNMKLVLGLRGMSDNSLQQLMAMFCLFGISSVLNGEEQPHLRHLFLLEEAHHVAGQPSGSAELLTVSQLLATQVELGLVQGRSKGCGFIIVDQQPGTRLISTVTANTSMKICHNLLGKDGEIMAQAMGLTDAVNFSTLGVGEAYIKPADQYPAVRARIRL